MVQIIPNDDTKQALRIQRFLIAFGTYILWMLIALYCYYDGWFVRYPLPFIWIFTLIIATNVVFYFLFRTGLNRRFKDPSLTMLQMTLATVWTMVMAYCLDQGRGIMLLLYMVVFTFGTFKLNFRQFCILSAIALTGYGSVITLLDINYPQSVNIKLELLNLGTLLVVLLWFSFIGSYINELRKKLSVANNELHTINQELNNANALIKQQSIHDDLTGTYNRRHIFHILQREMGLADREKFTFALCIFDLDEFKKVNDRYGHLVGDIVLRVLSQQIKDHIRKEDYLGRYGGEEFVLILAYPDIEHALLCVNRIMKVVSETRYPGLPDDFHMTISMGLTQYNAHENMDTFLKRADDALYKAKASGKNCIVCDPALDVPPSVDQAAGGESPK